MSLKIDTKKNISSQDAGDRMKKDTYLQSVNGTSVTGRDFYNQERSSIYSGKYNVDQQKNVFSCNKVSFRPPPSDIQWKPKDPININIKAAVLAA